MIHGSVRAEAARLWNRLVRLHRFCRKRNWPWPTKAKFEAWAKGKFPGLHSQSVQQTIAEFLEAVDSARQLRANGNAEARYPWRLQRYRDVTFTNQAPRLVGNTMVLPCGRLDGKRAYLSVPLPKGFAYPGKFCELRLEFGKVAMVFEVADAVAAASASIIGVDLGVNTLIAATDGVTAVLVSGREAKAIIQKRNKELAELVGRQSRHAKGSKRWRRLQRAKRRMLAKTRRKTKDLAHKATRIVANAFPGAFAYVGAPFNEAASKIRSKTAQTVSQAITGVITSQLAYKLAGGVEVIGEHYTSQTCPVCGERHKCRRLYRCRQCGYAAPRDVVGSLNRRPLRKLSRRRSSGGYPASSSVQLPLAA